MVQATRVPALPTRCGRPGVSEIDSNGSKLLYFRKLRLFKPLHRSRPTPNGFFGISSH
ncbi:MAG: hypothetical protein K2F88_06475 [Duncaniella sp.]|nr:hypothetical protein [Duncaniella sp.]